MKEIIEEVKHESVEHVTYYQAVDGTKFINKEECRLYEESAHGVLRARLQKLVVAGPLCAWDLMGGYEDNEVLAIKISNEEDKDVLLQNFYLDQPWILEEHHAKRHQHMIDLINIAWKQDDLILFGLNCDKELYLIDTRNNIVGRLNSLDKVEKKEEPKDDAEMQGEQ